MAVWLDTVQNGFSDLTKGASRLRLVMKKTSQMIVRKSSQSRAVMKRIGLDECLFKGRRITPKGT